MAPTNKLLETDDLKNHPTLTRTQSMLSEVPTISLCSIISKFEKKRLGHHANIFLILIKHNVPMAKIQTNLA